MVLKEVDPMFQIFHMLIATAIGLSINYTLPAPNHLHSCFDLKILKVRLNMVGMYSFCIK